MSLAAGALAAAEVALNRVLHLDAALLRLLAPLAGMTLLLETQSPAQSLYVQPHEQGLHLVQHWAGPVDCRLSAPAAAWLRLLLETDKKARLQAPPFVLQGDSSLALQLADILCSLQLDGAQLLSRHIGVLPVALLEAAARRGGRWARQAGSALQQSLGAYLSTESALLPLRAEGEARFAELLELEQRLTALEQRVAQLQGGAP